MAIVTGLVLKPKLKQAEKELAAMGCAVLGVGAYPPDSRYWRVTWAEPITRTITDSNRPQEVGG